MQLEECFLEMVCHARWVLNYCTTRINSNTAATYSEDIQLLSVALDDLSKPHSTDEETPLDIPPHVVSALSRGVAYLLLGEDIIGKAPPTMHPFLVQMAAKRTESAKQAQVIVVRWFINSGLVTIEELLAVIYGPETTIENYDSDYDAQMAVATSLSSSEPFYLGAHVTILRALLLHYCTTVFTAEDIISHVTKINPTVSADLYTLEDTLLHWIRTVLSLVPSTPVIDYIRENVADIYLNTNDGRVLSLIIHYYRPDLLPVESMQLTSAATADDHYAELLPDEDENVAVPLAGWQREANWSNIISAGEALGLWIGVYNDELVTHGFCTLQLHVLRIVEELFAVLAVGAEDRMEQIMEASDDDGNNNTKQTKNSLRQSQLIIRTSSDGRSSALGNNNKNGGHLTADYNVRNKHKNNTTTPPAAAYSPNDNTTASDMSIELDNNSSLLIVTAPSPCTAAANGGVPKKKVPMSSVSVKQSTNTNTKQSTTLDNSGVVLEEGSHYVSTYGGEDEDKEEAHDDDLILRSNNESRADRLVVARGESALDDPNIADDDDDDQINTSTALAIAKTLAGNGEGGRHTSSHSTSTSFLRSRGQQGTGEESVRSSVGSRFETIVSPDPSTAKAVDTLGEVRGSSSSVRRQIFASPEAEGDEDDGYTPSVASRQGGANNGRTSQNTRNGSRKGKGAEDHDHDDQRKPFDDPLADQRKGDYNIILTNMFLQGFAIPVSKKAPPPPTTTTTANSKAATTKNNAAVMEEAPLLLSDDGPVLSSSMSMKAPKNKPNTAEGSYHPNKPPLAASSSSVTSIAANEATQDLSAFVVKSSREGGVIISRVLEQNFSASNGTHHQADNGDDVVLVGGGPDGPEMAIGTSPVKGAERLESRGGSRLGVPPSNGDGDKDDSDIPIIKRSLQKMQLSKSARPVDVTTSASLRPSSFMPTVVQGSIHKEGITELIHELKAMCQVPPPPAPQTIGKNEPANAATAATLSSQSRRGTETEKDIREQNKELRRALERQQKLVAAFLVKVEKGLSDPTSFKEVVRQLGGEGAALSPSPTYNTRVMAANPRASLHSIGVGNSFAGTWTNSSLASPFGVEESKRGGKLSKLPKLRDIADGEEILSLAEDGVSSGSPRPAPAVGANTRVTPSLLSVSKLHSNSHSSEGDLPLLGSTSGLNPLLSSTGPITGHRGPQAQQPLPLGSLGSTVNVSTSSLKRAEGASGAPLKPSKPTAPPVLDVSIEAFKANPPKGAKGVKAIPPRLAQRLAQANEAFDAKNKKGGGGGTGNVIKITGAGKPVSGSDAASAPPSSGGGMPRLPSITRKPSSAGPASGATGALSMPSQAAAHPPVRTWNNKNSVTLALKHALLPGAMNKTILENVMTVIDRCEEDHAVAAQEMGGQLQFVILLKDEFAHAFKGVYMLKPDGLLSKLFGVGPALVYAGPNLATYEQTNPNAPPPTDQVVEVAANSSKLFPKFFKYDTTSKKFTVMQHKEANQTTDAVSFAKINHKINRAQVM